MAKKYNRKNIDSILTVELSRLLKDFYTFEYEHKKFLLSCILTIYDFRNKD